MRNHNHVVATGLGPTKVVSFEVPYVKTARPGMAHVTLTPERALELACWIVFAVDPQETKFDEILRQIEDA